MTPERRKCPMRFPPSRKEGPLDLPRIDLSCLGKSISITPRLRIIWNIFNKCFGYFRWLPFFLSAIRKHCGRNSGAKICRGYFGQRKGSVGAGEDQEGYQGNHQGAWDLSGRLQILILEGCLHFLFIIIGTSLQFESWFLPWILMVPCEIFHVIDVY